MERKRRKESNMSEMIVCYTDGKETWKVLAIRQNTKGELFCSLLGKKIDFHASRHKDGTFHWKANGKVFGKPFPPRTPLDKFSGIETLGTNFINHNKPRNPDLLGYRTQPYDKLVLIDTRNIKGCINFIPFLIDFSTVPSKLLDDFVSPYEEIHLVKKHKIGFGVAVLDSGKK